MEAEQAKKSNKGMNKMLLILGAALVVLVLVGVGFFVLNRGEDNASDDSDSNIVMREVTAEEIGLEMEVVTKPDGDYMRYDIKKLDGIKKIDGSFDYEAEDRGLQGVIVEVDVEGGDYTLPDDIYLGTCSAVCTPHKVTSDITAVFKITFTNGEIGQLEESLPIETE